MIKQYNLIPMITITILTVETKPPHQREATACFVMHKHTWRMELKLT